MVGLSSTQQESFKLRHPHHAKRSSPHAPSRPPADSPARSARGSRPHQRNAEITADRISSQKTAVSSGSASSSSTSENLNQFLDFTTPSVQLQYLPKSCFWDDFSKKWKQLEAESVPFYLLGDLWSSFNEWSAYGAGVPLVLKGEESVVQYYVPYLSALQLYTNSNFRRCVSIRKPGEESDVSSESDLRDTSSEASSDGELDGVLNLGRRNTCRNFDARLRHPGLSNSGKMQSFAECCRRSNPYGKFEGGIDEEQIWEPRERPCCVFEYFEHAAPYSRVPLVDKITELSGDCPQLNTLRSVDLSSESWFSIAWYPIYRIPTGPTLRDLATCFLTFHSLSTPFHGLKAGVDRPLQNKRMLSSHISVCDKLEKALLQSFGLTSYKLRGAFWTSPGSSECRTALDLQESAEIWLKERSVQHPDFEFYMSRSVVSRE